MTIVGLITYVPQQDFRPQSWGDRGREVVNLFKWRTMAGRQWGVWLIAVFFGVPAGAVGAIAGWPDADRIGSAALLGVSSIIGWIGLKCLDARIARGKLEADAASGGSDEPTT